MTGFSFNPDNADSEPPVPPPPEQSVACDDWWPAINLATARQVVRLDTTVTADRLRDAIRHAMLEIATAPVMAAWRAAREAEDYAALEDVPANIEVDGKSDYVLRWERAVLSVVGGDLGERGMGQGLSAVGADRAEALRADVDVHQRNVRYAVRDFLGLPRIRARLI